MIFPLLVDHAQHDHALVMAHGIGADKFFLCVVAFLQLVENRIAEFLPVQILGLHALGHKIDAEARKYSVFQALKIPVVGMCFGWTVFCAVSMRRVMSPDSIGMPSSMPSRSSNFETHSLAKMRIKSSSSAR